MNRQASELLRIAKELVAGYRPGTGTIKFVIGDEVRAGTGRLVWKITNVGVEYIVYDENRKYVGSYMHEHVGKYCEPIGWTPNNNPAGVQKNGYGKVGNVVKALKPLMGNRDVEIGKEYQILLVRETYWGEGINTSKRLERADPDNLEPAAAEPRDGDGRTPTEAFKAEFGGVGAKVVDSPYWTSSETLGVVQAVSSKGMVKVGLYSVSSGRVKWEGQESFHPDSTTIDEIRVYKPRLGNGRWTWWSDKHSISPYTGGKLTRLLD